MTPAHHDDAGAAMQAEFDTQIVHHGWTRARVAVACGLCAFWIVAIGAGVWIAG